VVIPGIIAYVMNTGPNGEITSAFTDPSFISDSGSIINDNAFPWLIKEFIPVGLKGLVLAALAAAIVSSIASMLNSTATIFTMDIYKPYFNKGRSDKNLVTVGRLSATIALIIAVILAPQLKNLGQVFQYIQEYTGIVSPGILAVFMLGLFYKKTTNKAAIWGVLLSIPIALYFKVGPNDWVDSWLFVELPFMHQMFITWILTMLIMVVISYAETKGKDHDRAIIISKTLFKTGPVFNICGFAILLIVAMLYALFW
jgi:SSS family solute:Na+ symporter